MSNCRQCGLDHQRLGISIDGRTLHRSADKSKHMLRASGGAWAFESTLLSRHPEVDYVIIIDRNSGETWRVDRRTFDAQSFPFSAAGRDQRALSLRYWDDGHERHEPEPEGVQLILTNSAEVNGTRFEKAKKPRPRIEPKRHGW